MLIDVFRRRFKALDETLKRENIIGEQDDGDLEQGVNNGKNVAQKPKDKWNMKSLGNMLRLENFRKKWRMRFLAKSKPFLLLHF